MEHILKEKLDINELKLCPTRGTIRRIETDKGPLFLKIGSAEHGEDLVVGEFESLKAIEQTNQIRCPKPLTFFEYKKEWILVTSYEEMGKGMNYDEHELGAQLARMHLHNSELSKDDCLVRTEDEDNQRVEKFGFPVPTCCGELPQINDWIDDWLKGERDLNNYTELLYRKCNELLKNRANVIPSLVHGDLWAGNWSFIDNEPIIFDPSASYSDPEFEFGIIQMFGGVTPKFYDGYHSIIKKQKGFAERVKLYELYHHLNHWNHFGRSYKMSSMHLISDIIA